MGTAGFAAINHRHGKRCYALRRRGVQGIVLIQGLLGLCSKQTFLTEPLAMEDTEEKKSAFFPSLERCATLEIRVVVFFKKDVCRLPLITYKCT